MHPSALSGAALRARPFAKQENGNLISELSQKTIIVVDDDEAVRDSLSVMLSLAGLRVRACSSGDALLTLLEGQTPDCLVIDVHMPGLNGLELVERLNGAGGGIPVILISGNMDSRTEAYARRLGVLHLLKKPFPGTVLIEVVKDIVG